MKNATRQFEQNINEFLQRAGCEAMHITNGSVSAVRPGGAGTTYRISVEVYEDVETKEATRRFRARAARRFGLPVCTRYGATPEAARDNLQWQVLDNFRLPTSSPLISGLI